MKISVALCSFNGEQYIRDQIDSIIGQTYPVNQIVICDDNSSDRTLDILYEIADNNKEIDFVIHRNTRNLGVIKNFEQALSLCDGDVIFLSDQDDLWRRDKVATFVHYFEENPADNVVFCNAMFIDAKGNKLTNNTLFDVFKIGQFKPIWSEIPKFELVHNVGGTYGSSMAVRRRFLHEVLPFISSQNVLHDLQLSIAASILGCLGVIWDSLTFYRLHGNNVCGINLKQFDATKKNEKLDFSRIVEPDKLLDNVSSFISNHHSPHVSFYITRVNNYSSIKGKIRLLFNWRSYRKQLGKYWYKFLLSDLKYGILSR